MLPKTKILGKKKEKPMDIKGVWRKYARLRLYRAVHDLRLDSRATRARSLPAPHRPPHADVLSTKEAYFLYRPPLAQHPRLSCGVANSSMGYLFLDLVAPYQMGLLGGYRYDLRRDLVYRFLGRTLVVESGKPRDGSNIYAHYRATIIRSTDIQTPVGL